MILFQTFVMTIIIAGAYKFFDMEVELDFKQAVLFSSFMVAFHLIFVLLYTFTGNRGDGYLTQIALISLILTVPTAIIHCFIKLVGGREYGENVGFMTVFVAIIFAIITAIPGVVSTREEVLSKREYPIFRYETVYQNERIEPQLLCYYQEGNKVKNVSISATSNAILAGSLDKVVFEQKATITSFLGINTTDVKEDRTIYLTTKRYEQ